MNSMITNDKFLNEFFCSLGTLIKQAIYPSHINRMKQKQHNKARKSSMVINSSSKQQSNKSSKPINSSSIKQQQTNKNMMLILYGMI